VLPYVQARDLVVWGRQETHVAAPAEGLLAVLFRALPKLRSRMPHHFDEWCVLRSSGLATILDVPSGQGGCHSRE
jgi:hypothetical protein